MNVVPGTASLLEELDSMLIVTSFFYKFIGYVFVKLVEF